MKKKVTFKMEMWFWNTRQKPFDYYDYRNLEVGNIFD